MKCYKITDENDQTYGGCQWGEGVTHTADGKGGLCTEHWIHAYSHKLIAVVMNPVHGNYHLMHLWECEAELGEDDRGLKFGTTKLTTIKRVSIPRMSNAVKVRFAIYCALEVHKDKGFKKWADNWLSGKGRSETAAMAAETAARAAVRTAWAAVRAAWAAVRAAEAAAGAAAGAAARAAEAAAWAAAEAAWAAAEAADIDLISFIKKAVKDEQDMVKEK